MTVRIVKVERPNGKVTRVEAEIGDIEIYFISIEGKPQEVRRARHGIQIEDPYHPEDTYWISPADFRQLMARVRKIFSENRSIPVQGQLIGTT